MTKFTDEVEIDAPTQVGLVVTGPVTGVGAGAQLTTAGTGGRGWEILATGQKSAQGQDKLNIRDLGNGQDVFTITSNGKVGIGTTLPFAALTVNAPDEGGLSVSGPAAAVGAAVTLAPAGRVGGGGGVLGSFLTSWQILATGQTASQGSDKLNFSYLVGDVGHFSSIDALTITSDTRVGYSKVGIGTTNPGFKLEIDAPDQLGLHVAGPSAGVGAGISLSAANAGTNANSWEILATGDHAAQGPDKLNIRYINTAADIFAIHKSGTTTVQGSADPLLVINHTGGSGNPALWFEQDGAAKAFIWWDQKNSVLNLGTSVTNPVVSIQDNGNVAFTGDVTLTGKDCAEQFDIANADRVEPGTVMALGEDGVLEESQFAYDKRVAGVVSGAGDYKPGIVLGQQGSQPNRKPIALVGRVYCKVDAQYGAVETGDLLTTSPTPGHAMKATDQLKAFGAVIGKALRPLTAGRRLIPILVALQ